jgi:hypothetical protein
LLLFFGGVSAQAIPAGDYDHTCRDFHETRDSFTATCRGPNGKWSRSTVLFSSCAGRVHVRNRGGRLVCSIY